MFHASPDSLAEIAALRRSVAAAEQALKFGGVVHPDDLARLLAVAKGQLTALDSVMRPDVGARWEMVDTEAPPYVSGPHVEAVLGKGARIEFQRVEVADVTLHLEPDFAAHDALLRSLRTVEGAE